MLPKARTFRNFWPAPSLFARRPLMNAALATLTGVALSTRIPYGLWMWVALLFCLLIWLLLRKYGRRCFIFLLCGAGFLGLTRGAMELHAPALPDTGRWMVEGMVQGTVRRNQKAAMFILSGVRVRPTDSETWTAIQSNLYVYDPNVPGADLNHGQRVGLRGTSYLPDTARNPGGFDARMWLAQSGAHVRLYAAAPAGILSPAKFSVYGAALSINASLGKKADSLFGRAAPVVRAMLLGDQTAMEDNWNSWMRDSGIIHILAVSGLHVGLWYMMLEQLLKRLPVSPRARWLMLALLLSLYVLLTGLKVSAIRAAIMLLLVQGGRVARRKVDPLTSLAVAAGAILLVRPLDLFSAGFQMSFCAVLGIVLLGVPLKKAFAPMPEYLAKALSTTQSAQVGILPVLVYWFGKVSVISLAANLAAIPLAGLLIPVSAIAMALSALWAPLGFLFAESAKGLVALILLIAKMGAAMPYSTLRFAVFAWYTLIVYYLCVLLCSTAVVWPWRTRLLCMGAACMLAAGVGGLTAYRGVWYVQLDVGQALSGVLHAGNKVFVYDCGNENSDLTEYLLYTGSSVEGLFLSHPHTDHVGGAMELLDAGIPVKTVYVPVDAARYGADPLYETILERVHARNIPVVEVKAGDVLDLGGLPATVIAPDEGSGLGRDGNSRSIVLRVEIGGRALLLCGDADVIDPANVDCDVLQVPHHGSRNATGEDFLAGAGPAIALISAGRGNTYGHPHPETLARLKSAGAERYLTQESGALTLYFENETIRVEAFCP